MNISNIWKELKAPRIVRTGLKPYKTKGFSKSDSELKAGETIIVILLFLKTGNFMFGCRFLSFETKSNENLGLICQIGPPMKLHQLLIYHFVDFTRFLDWKCSHVVFKGACVFKGYLLVNKKKLK